MMQRHAKREQDSASGTTNGISTDARHTIAPSGSTSGILDPAASLPPWACANPNQKHSREGASNAAAVLAGISIPTLHKVNGPDAMDRPSLVAPATPTSPPPEYAKHLTCSFSHTQQLGAECKQPSRPKLQVIIPQGPTIPMGQGDHRHQAQQQTLHAQDLCPNPASLTASGLELELDSPPYSLPQRCPLPSLEVEATSRQPSITSPMLASTAAPMIDCLLAYDEQRAHSNGASIACPASIAQAAIHDMQACTSAVMKQACLSEPPCGKSHHHHHHSTRTTARAHDKASSSRHRTDGGAPSQLQHPNSSPQQRLSLTSRSRSHSHSRRTVTQPPCLSPSKANMRTNVIVEGVDCLSGPLPKIHVSPKPALQRCHSYHSNPQVLMMPSPHLAQYAMLAPAGSSGSASRRGSAVLGGVMSGGGAAATPMASLSMALRNATTAAAVHMQAHTHSQVALSGTSAASRRSSVVSLAGTSGTFAEESAAEWMRLNSPASVAPSTASGLRRVPSAQVLQNAAMVTHLLTQVTGMRRSPSVTQQSHITLTRSDLSGDWTRALA